MDEGEINRQLRELVEQLKHENELLRAAFNYRNGQIESQTKSNPILYGRQKIFAALFRSFACCPDAF
jgi:cell shape-determining protein MreC